MEVATKYKCVYLNCGNTRDDGVSLFRFPIKDSIRARKWLENCGNSFLLNFSDELEELKDYKVCEKHFENSAFTDNNFKIRLTKNAIPLPFQQTSNESYEGRSANTMNNQVPM